MKRKSVILAALALTMAVAASMTALAGEAGWVHDGKGWRYGTDEAGTQWHNDGWRWLDGDGDGISQCYYFGADGYILTDTLVPDGYGYTVNGDGAWICDGVVKTIGRGSEIYCDRTLCDIAGAYLNVNLEDDIYNKYGINKTAMEMFFQSREENAEYGELSETSMHGYDHIVTYGNGFEITYDDSSDNMEVGSLSVSKSRADLNNNYLLKFYFPNHQPKRDRVSDSMEKDAMLREMGFDMISDSSVYDSVWWGISDGDNRLRVSWYCNDTLSLGRP